MQIAAGRWRDTMLAAPTSMARSGVCRRRTSVGFTESGAILVHTPALWRLEGKSMPCLGAALSFGMQGRVDASVEFRHVDLGLEA